MIRLRRARQMLPNFDHRPTAPRQANGGFGDLRCIGDGFRRPVGLAVGQVSIRSNTARKTDDNYGNYFAIGSDR